MSLCLYSSFVSQQEQAPFYPKLISMHVLQVRLEACDIGFARKVVLLLRTLDKLRKLISMHVLQVRLNLILQHHFIILTQGTSVIIASHFTSLFLPFGSFLFSAVPLSLFLAQLFFLEEGLERGKDKGRRRRKKEREEGKKKGEEEKGKEEKEKEGEERKGR